MTNNNNSDEDGDTESIVYKRCPCEVKIVCVRCETETETETNLNLLDDQRDIENKEFIDGLKHTKRVWKVPWFILMMSFLQISFYVIANNCVRQRLMFMPETINEYWRYVTYILLHSDVLHLSMNIALQFVISFCLESEQGHFKVAVIYIIGGISGSLATLVLQPQLSLMGASAGVYALLMSHIPHLIKNFHNLSQRYLRISALVILFISDVCFTTFHVLVNHNTNPRICLEAHAAGAFSGLIFGFFLYGASSLSWPATFNRRSRCGQNV